jgi:transcriptional regulator GlxA family with amidase domain
VPFVDEDRQAALIRILEFATRHLTLDITDHLVAPPEQLPRLVRMVCDQARRTFKGEVSLREIAKHTGVTTEHLCRVFHHATGLRFREYVGRLRAEYARDLLLTTDRSVTEIAFASGFQSVSQFNRVFRMVHGASPQRIRKGVTSSWSKQSQTA